MPHVVKGIVPLKTEGVPLFEGRLKCDQFLVRIAVFLSHSLRLIRVDLGSGAFFSIENYRSLDSIDKILNEVATGFLDRFRLSRGMVMTPKDNEIKFILILDGHLVFGKDVHESLAEQDCEVAYSFCGLIRLKDDAWFPSRGFLQKVDGLYQRMSFFLKWNPMKFHMGCGR